MSRIMSLVSAHKFVLRRPASAPMQLRLFSKKTARSNTCNNGTSKETKALKPAKGNKTLFFRKMSSSVVPGDAGECRITNILKEKFPNATQILVEDISGGCGDMYEVHMESEKDFAGLRTVAQHKLVTNALKDEVAKMHGLRIFTSVPEK